jgi:hypothetical protein
LPIVHMRTTSTPAKDGVIPRGYQGTREVGKKKEKRIPWGEPGEALEPARAGLAALKFESGHGQERKIALSISIEKK